MTALYNCVTSHTGRARVFLPPGHCHRAGGHQLGGGHDHQVAHVDQEVQHRHHGDGDQDSPGKIHLQEGNIKDMSLLCDVTVMYFFVCGFRNQCTKSPGGGNKMRRFQYLIEKRFRLSQALIHNSKGRAYSHASEY